MPAVPVPHRPARAHLALPPEEPLELVTPPGPVPAGGGWSSAVLPAASTLPVLALGATGNAHGTGLLLALLVIPAVGGSVAVHLAQRRRAKREVKAARDRWARHLAERVAEARAAAGEQRLALDRLHPGDLVAAVEAGAAFERRPGDGDALTVAVGIGDVPARRPLVRSRAGPLEVVSADLDAAAEAAVRAAAVLPGAAICVDLRHHRVLAVIGTKAEVGPVLRRVLGELAALHAPGELVLAGTALGTRGLGDGVGPGNGMGDGVGVGEGVDLGGDLGDELDVDDELGVGARHGTGVPHAGGGPGIHATPPALAEWLTTADETVLRVALIDAYAPGACPALDLALTLPGTVAVVGVRSPALVPAPAAAVLDIAAGTLRAGPRAQHLEALETLDAPTADHLMEVIRERAPAATAAAPTLAELLSAPRGQELDVPIGLDLAGGPVVLRLAESVAGGDGPHGLLVGATGSGKSVLLRTIVAGLAARHTPHELTMLLVDYKGGAAFADLADLPHVGGLVTNLAEDPGLLRRVALALGAELDRRQRLLRAAGVESRRALGGGLPALLIAVDEAGELLAADPELADVFARVGRVGRSLGVHLLLATQHWDAGRLHSLDTHLRYRLCLRTFTAEDSRAVLGNDAAMRLPSRSGAGWLAVDGVQRRVDVLAPPAEASLVVPEYDGQADPVWLAPLPALVPWPGDGTIGRVDRPGTRAQPPLRLDLDGAGGHVAVAGGPRSGVTTALRAVVYAACADRGPTDLQVHVLDLAGGLGDLADLRQVGTVAALHQPALVRAVVGAVRDELCRRAVAAAGAGDTGGGDTGGGDTGGGGAGAGRAGASTADPAGGRCPRLLLVVDGAGLLCSDDGAVEEALADIAARGLAYDVHLVLGVRRWSELRRGLFDASGTRLELRLGDATESLAGRAAAAQLPSGVPGRGLLADGAVFQVALPDAAALPSWPGRVPPVVLLPRRVLEPVHAGDGAFPLGLGGPSAGLVSLDLTRPGRHLLVSGDAGSGRTTVLRRVVRHLAAAGSGAAVHVVDPRRTLLDVATGTASWSCSPEAAGVALTDVVAELRTRLPPPDALPAELAARAEVAARSPDRRPRLVVVLDDLDLLDGGPLGGGPLMPVLAALAALLPYAPEIGLQVVLARSAGARVFDPLVQRLRASAPWRLDLPGEHLEGPAAGRGAPTLVGRALLTDGRGPARTIQCFTDGV